MRPVPPLSHLHFFAPEGEEEKRIRQELGVGHAGDEPANSMQGDSAASDMDVDSEPGKFRTTTLTAGDRLTSISHTISTQLEVSSAPSLSSRTPAVQQPALSAPTIPTTAPNVPTPSDSALHAKPPSTIAELDAPPIGSLGSTSFMSPAAVDKGKRTEVAPSAMAPRMVDDDDEPIPELDSGSDDFEEDEGEDEDEEDGTRRSSSLI